MRLRELRHRYLEEGNTSAAWIYSPSIASGMDLNLKLAHFLDSNVGQAAFVHMAIAGEGREGQHDWVPDISFVLVLLAVADTEAEVGTVPAQVALVVVLDGIHSSCLHSAYFQVVVKGTRPAVGEAVAASPPENRKAGHSSSASELDSWELEEAKLMSSWSASDPGVGQHRRCSRRPPPARNSKHVRTDLDAAHQNVPAHSRPCCQSIMIVPTSPIPPDSSGRRWDSETPAHDAEGNHPGLNI
jgi:hypothetical protein